MRTCGPSSVQEFDMSAQIMATVAAACSAACTAFAERLGLFTGVVAVAVSLGGCTAATVPMLGADPADPGVRVAPVGYRSTVAPYASLRPTTPAGWKEQNRRVTPSPQSGHSGAHHDKHQ